MKRLMGLMMVLLVVAVAFMVFAPTPAEAAAVSPAKINLPKATVVYFGNHTFANTHHTDTLVWSSDRNFADTANYDVAVFVSGKTTTGILTGTVLNDSSIIVASNTATDSTLVYYYQVVLKAQ